MNCPCVWCRVEADRDYVSRVDRGWPRWLAYLAGTPSSSSVDEARESVARFDALLREGRIGVGVLGAVVCPDVSTAAEITETFGLRRPA